jgi:DNA-binding response OmpR family regulator
MHTHCALKVLLVDDDRDIVEASSMRLRSAGFETLAAGDGAEGLALAERHHPDAIVLDVRMPRLDGLSALTELRKNTLTSDIPVIMLSASLLDQQAALDAGARLFVTKPYRSQHLVDAVKFVTHEPH